jgi:dTMP kinase
MARKGAFVVVEGLDGSGKSTQAKLLAAKLKSTHSAVCTAEPSRGKIGLFIRNRVLFGETRYPSEVEALLFAADRIDHINNKIMPLLREGCLVISDRYLYSSFAYQGSAGLKLNWIQTINAHALKPDLALFIDVSPEVVLQRLKRKRSVMENLETQRKVREMYLRFVEGGELIRIDGDASRIAVSEKVFSAVMAFLRTWC